ncbi:hypothetical protein DMENIID0001_015860 [Sergentomyia squamirostris]
MFHKVTTILLLFFITGVLSRFHHDHHDINFELEDVEVPEEDVERLAAKKSIDRLRAILLEPEIPYDSQISEALHADIPHKKLIRLHCPPGEMMDHRGRCRQVW